MKTVLALILSLRAFYSSAHEINDRVQSNEGPVAFAIIRIENEQMGTQCDIDGLFSLDLEAGDYIIQVSSQGFRDKELSIRIPSNEELIIALEPDPLGIDEVVVSADRHEEKSRNASIQVSKIDAQVLERSGSQNMAEGLNFSSGMRVENNCQPCGFTQVRMPGLEGGYTQILFNGRRIFSQVNTMYGLEQIPAD